MASVPSTTYQNFGTVNAVSHAIVTAKPAEIVAIRVSSVNAAIRYFQMWDRVTDVAGGEVGTGPAPYTAAVPVDASKLRVISFDLPAGSATAPASLELDDVFFSGMERFSTGLVWAFSTAAQTCTLGTAADHAVTIRWRQAG